jgi:hypothetical protein
MPEGRKRIAGSAPERMNSPLENRKIRLRGLRPRRPGATAELQIWMVDSSVAPWFGAREGFARALPSE